MAFPLKALNLDSDRVNSFLLALTAWQVCVLNLQIDISAGLGNQVGHDSLQEWLEMGLEAASELRDGVLNGEDLRV